MWSAVRGPAVAFAVGVLWCAGIVAPGADASAVKPAGPYTLESAPGSPYTVPGDVGSVAVGNFKADGLTDLAAASSITSPSSPPGVAELSVLLAGASGSFQVARSSGIVFSDGWAAGGPAAVAAADFNGDGKLDLAVGNAGRATASGNAGGVSVFLGNGDGTFPTAPSTQTVLGVDPVQVVAADLNGDGKPDLVTLNSNDSISVLIGNGDGTFAPAPGSPIALGGGTAGSIAVGDFNGDGKPDLAITNPMQGTVSVLLGNGDGSFTPAPGSPIALGGGMPGSIAVGDFTGDGKPDLAIANAPAGDVSVLLGSGGGRFVPAVGSPIAVSPTGSVNGIATGDYTARGKQDLAVTAVSASGSGLYLLSGDGSGGFRSAPGSPFPAGQAPQLLAGGSFDGHAGVVLTPQTCCLIQQGELSVLFFTQTAPAPTTAQLKAILLRQLTTTKRAVGIKFRLRRPTYTYRFQSPEAGRLVIKWTATGSKRRSSHAANTVIGSGTATFDVPGTKQVKIALTHAGRLLLKRRSRLKVIATAALTPPGKAAITTTTTITLSR